MADAAVDRISANSTFIPPEADDLDDAWILAARVCDTRIYRDLLTYMDGAMLSISIENQAGEVLTKREVLYIEEERLDFTGAWITDKTFALKVYEDAALPESDRTDVPIGEFVLSVPTP